MSLSLPVPQSITLHTEHEHPQHRKRTYKLLPTDMTMPLWKEFMLSLPLSTSGIMLGSALSHRIRGDDSMPEIGVGALGSAVGSIIGRQKADEHPKSFGKQLLWSYGLPLLTGLGSAAATRAIAGDRDFSSPPAAVKESSILKKSPVSFWMSCLTR